MNPETIQHLDMRQHPKVTGWHRQRLAYIYVRQSTTKQIHRNQESQQYQYRLQLRAQELGWPEERIKVIDSDLGLSGQHAEASSHPPRWERVAAARSWLKRSAVHLKMLSLKTYLLA